MTGFPACTLPRVAFTDRIEEIAGIGATSLIAAVSDHEFRFRPEARDALQRLIEAEAGCCAQIDMSLEDRDGELRLTVTGPGSQVFHTAFTAR